MTITYFLADKMQLPIASVLGSDSVVVAVVVDAAILLLFLLYCPLFHLLCV